MRRGAPCDGRPRERSVARPTAAASGDRQGCPTCFQKAARPSGPTHQWRHMSRDPRAGGPFRCQDGAARMAPHVPRYRLWPNSSTWTTRPDHLSDAVGEHDKAFRCRESRVAGREHERRTLRLIQDIVARREDSRWWDDGGPDYSVIEDAILGREHDPVAFAELV
jgi:hypothetical protein